MDYVQLHTTAAERSPKLLNWINSWWPPDLPKLTILEKNGWVDVYEQSDVNVWLPPPAVGDAAMEFLSWMIHKRSWNMHIVMIPTCWTSL